MPKSRVRPTQEAKELLAEIKQMHGEIAYLLGVFSKMAPPKPADPSPKLDEKGYMVPYEPMPWVYTGGGYEKRWAPPEKRKGKPQRGYYLEARLTRWAYREMYGVEPPYVD